MNRELRKTSLILTLVGALTALLVLFQNCSPNAIDNLSLNANGLPYEGRPDGFGLADPIDLSDLDVESEPAGGLTYAKCSGASGTGSMYLLKFTYDLSKGYMSEALVYEDLLKGGGAQSGASVKLKATDFTGYHMNNQIPFGENDIYKIQFDPAALTVRFFIIYSISGKNKEFNFSCANP